MKITSQELEDLATWDVRKYNCDERIPGDGNFPKDRDAAEKLQKQKKAINSGRPPKPIDLILRLKRVIKGLKIPNSGAFLIKNQ